MKYPQRIIGMFKSALADDDMDAMNMVAHECAHYDHNSGAMDNPGYAQNWYYDLANQLAKQNVETERYANLNAWAFSDPMHE